MAKVVSFKKFASLFSLLIFFYANGFAEGKVLQKKISISVQNSSTEAVLDLIAEKANCLFSYNSDIIDNQKVVSIDTKNTELYKIIDQIFDGKIEALESGRYIILKKKVQSQLSEKKLDTGKSVKIKKSDFGVEGVVFDKLTGEKIENVSVYEIGQSNVALTDKQGTYRLNVTSAKPEIGIAFSAKDYLDTVLIISAKDTAIHLGLEALPKQNSMQAPKVLLAKLQNPAFSDELSKLPIVAYSVPVKKRFLEDQLTFIEKQRAQFSVLPFAGTNGLMSGNISNSLSFNLLAGYSYALDGLEIGSILNIVKTDVKGVQLSGLANIVGGRTEGMQIASVLNYNIGRVHGAQVSGFWNVARDSLYGMQISAFGNSLHGDFYGIQASGFANYSEKAVNGLQAASFANYSESDVYGYQIAGFANISKKNVKGIQVAGFVNVCSDSLHGIQVSGFGNRAKMVSKLQISSVVNLAQHVEGVQISLTNFADTVSGASFGIFSYIKKGLHRFELSYDLDRNAHVAFKTGIPKFYTVFATSVSTQNFETFGFAFGAGTQIGLIKRLFIDVELSQIQNFKYQNSTFNLNSTTRLNMDFGLKFFKHSALLFGPSLNVQPLRADGFAAPTHATEFQIFGSDFVLWLGGRVALRI